MLAVDKVSELYVRVLEPHRASEEVERARALLASALADRERQHRDSLVLCRALYPWGRMMLRPGSCHTRAGEADTIDSEP